MRSMASSTDPTSVRRRSGPANLSASSVAATERNLASSLNLARIRSSLGSPAGIRHPPVRIPRRIDGTQRHGSLSKLSLDVGRLSVSSSDDGFEGAGSALSHSPTAASSLPTVIRHRSAATPLAPLLHSPTINRSSTLNLNRSVPDPSPRLNTVRSVAGSPAATHCATPTANAAGARSCFNTTAPSPLRQPSSSALSSGLGTSSPCSEQRFRKLVGLANLGNTCFMASQVQSLACIPELLDHMSGGDALQHVNPRSASKGKVSSSFAALINDFISGPDGRVARANALKQAIGEVNHMFSSYAQQDSQEFLRALLSGIHEDMNRIVVKPPYVQIEELPNDTDRDLADRWWANYTARNASIASDLFCGQLKSEVTCRTCRHVSRTFDPFWDLSLQIEKGSCTLMECFEKFTTSELLTGDEQYYCSKCKRHCDAVKTLSLQRFPRILVVHLKRFSFSSGGYNRKIESMVQTPLHDVDFSRFARSRGKGDPAPVYDLYAVSNHYGGTGSGHYTAFGRVSRDHNSWAEFNDSEARMVPSTRVVSPAAYVLFFRRQL